MDDDNDGIYDLLERFDGCYGTHPFDHDNDGILDADDWDDDNDGILEGPIDIDALEALGLDPRNVSTDRRLDENIIHPWTGQAVGPFYLADQNPMDHDNDGVTDEDSDGSGPGRYDEDDDNSSGLVTSTTMASKTTSITMTTATVLTMSKTPTHTTHQSQQATQKLATFSTQHKLGISTPTEFTRAVSTSSVLNSTE